MPCDLHNLPMHFLRNSGSAGLLLAATLVIGGCGGESGPQAGRFTMHSLDVPAAAGSMGSNLVIGMDGTVVLSWIEPQGDQHRLLYSTLVDYLWSDPTVVTGGDNWFVNWADFPSVVPLSDTLWAAHWLVRQPAGGYAYDVLLSLSDDGGATWSEPIKPHNDNTPTEHGFVSLFPHESKVGLIWLDGRNMVNESPADETNGMTLRAASIAADLTIKNNTQVDGLICDCCQTDVAITDAGAIAVYRNRTEDETRDIYVAQLIENEWQPGHPVADDGWTISGCPINGPVVSADGNRVAVAWFTAADDRPRVRVARSQDSGASFSTPVDVVGDESFGRVGIALLPDDRLAISWLCKAPGEKAAVCLRSLSSTDQLGPVHVLSGNKNASSFSVPQLARSGEMLVAAWTVDANGGSFISSGQVPIASLD